ncbi:MAG: transcriptional regulator [Actinobacteria bacterium]|nr:transcriptional regulator [Actinomycetota bacterium]
MRERDKVYGAFVLAAAIIGIVAYGWFLHSAPIVTLQVVSFIAVATVLGIVGWIGYTMLTTPSPKLSEKKLSESSEGGR